MFLHSLLYFTIMYVTLYVLQLFSAYFDTTVGLKIETSSYTKIAEELKCPPKNVLFLTDIPRGK